MVVTGTMTAAFVLASSMVTPLYTSEATLTLNIRPEQAIKLDGVMPGIPIENSASSSFIRSEIDRIQSPAVIRDVVVGLALDRDPEFNGTDKARRWEVPAWLDEAARWLGIPAGTGDAAEEPAPKEPLDNAMETVGRRLTVKNDGRSYSVRLAFTSQDPEKAAAVANRFAEEYTALQIEEKNAATRRVTAWLGEKVEELKQRLNESETAAQRFREENGLLDALGSPVLDRQLEQVQAQLVAARAERFRAEARAGRLAGGSAAPRQMVNSEMLRSPLVQRLEEEATALRQRQADMMLRLGPSHPDYRNIDAQLAAVERKIGREAEKILMSLENDREAALAQEGDLQATLAALQEAANRQAAAVIHYNELQSEVQANRQMYMSFLERGKQTSEQNFQYADITLLSRAVPARKPSFPNPAMFGVTGLLIGAALSVLLALLREKTDRTIRSPTQLEADTGLPSLGMIPRLPRSISANPVRSFNAGRTSIHTDSLRSIFTKLDCTAEEAMPKLLMVCSSLPDEGKSTFCASLAATIRRSGQRVIVVDCDLRRSTVSRLFGRKDPAKTLTDVLTGQATLQEAIFTEEVSGIDCIASRPGRDRPQDLLGRANMQPILELLSERYDAVILDTPPIMVVSDAAQLAKLVGAVVYVVKWGATPKDLVLQGLRELTQAKGRLAGLVLSQVDQKKYQEYFYGPRHRQLVRRYYRKTSDRYSVFTPAE